MKLSIWQQWASNHSASFYVVGKFADVESAREAKGRVAKLVQDIADYLSDLIHTETFYESGRVPTPPEVSLSDELGVEWPKHSIEHDFRVSLFEDYVSVTNIVPTWQEPTIFEILLQKLGAEILGESSSDSEVPDPFFVNIRCKPHDANTFNKLKTEIEDYHAARKQYHALPIESQVRFKSEKVYSSPWHSYSANQATPRYQELTAGMGKISQSENGDEIVFQKWCFADLIMGLQAFVDYLHAKDCTEIRIEIGQSQWKTLLDEEV